jgi:hypothetical protein
MKKLFVLAYMALSLNCANAQKRIPVSIMSEAKKIMLGAFEVSATTKIEDVIKYLGKPDRIMKAAGTDRHYIYDSLGIAIDAGKEGKIVEAVSINFNWDNDKKMAMLPFKNTLTLDGYAITELSTTDMIRQNTMVKEIICPAPVICMSNPKAGGLALIIGYTKDNRMTQIAFGFTK